MGNVSDRTARLEELRKIVGDSSIAELEKCTWLNIERKALTSVPLGVCDLTGLVELWLYNNRLSSLPPEISKLTGLTRLGVGNNQLSSLPPELWELTGLTCLAVQNNKLSSLPPEISQLTGLAYLDVDRNPIEELPPQITALTKLKDLYIEWQGRMTIKRAPRGITNLPCWNNTNKPYSEMTYSFADALRKLQLYDPVPSSDPNSAPVTGDYADVMNVEFSPEAILGEGGFGTAYKVQLKKGIVAVKLLKKKAKPGTPEYDELTKEARMMINLRHTNIISLYAYGCRSQEVFYVMEYADGKSIWDVIKASGALPLDKSLLYSMHINAGLKYLHSQSPPVEHRDLKPENVLICKGVAKICDFGISSARDTIARTTGYQGTDNYASPESFLTDRSYGPMSDIYTFALVIWAMVAGKRPYDELARRQIMHQKEHQKLPEITPTTPAKLAALMNECWNTDPPKRPTAEAIESRLADIQKTPGPAVGEKGKSVKDMNTAELVVYLEGKNLIATFLTAIKENEVTGKDFVEFNQEALVADPFHLTAFQAKNIMKHVDAAKST